MKYLFGLLIISLLIAGCVSTLTEEGAPTSAKQIGESTPTGPATTANNTTNIPPTTQPPATTKPSVPPSTQADCSSLAPTCDACVAKSGCGWCKDSNSCFAGTLNGPVVSSCPSADWAIDANSCELVQEGGSCSQFTNCADCLSGSGCNWCIQGSVCADENSNEDCFGGWMENSFQCNYASR